MNETGKAAQTALITELTAEIVSAYVGKNMIPSNELPQLIKDVHTALLQAEGSHASNDTTDLKPAVSIKKSITDDYIICLEDGQKFKSLKRHLRAHYDMSPEQYREKWGLPADYPMVAPNYAQKRSALARKMGLGRKGA